MASFVQVVD